MDESKRIEEMALTWADKARTIIVVSQESYDAACAMLKDLFTVEQRILDHHKPIKEAAHRAHKMACEAESKLLTPVRDAKGILKLAVGKWEQEQEAKRLQAQREAEERQRKIDEDARLAVAVEAEAAGAPVETVNEILETPVVAAPVVVAPTFQRAQGVSTQTRWKAEGFDIKQTCAAVADGRVSPEVLMFNMPVLNGMARALKQTMNIPGVRAVPDVTVAVRKAG